MPKAATKGKTGKVEKRRTKKGKHLPDFALFFFLSSTAISNGMAC